LTTNDLHYTIGTKTHSLVISYQLNSAEDVVPNGINVLKVQPKFDKAKELEKSLKEQDPNFIPGY